jgi:L-threonylcarbamoyladenylate synthase
MQPERVETEVVRVHPQKPDETVMTRAAAVLRGGGLVAFPTETVYGLGANALDAEAVARIFAAKGRPAHNPLIVHVPDVAAARELVTEWPETAERLAELFWPGPLTLVLPRREVIPDIVTAGGPTVAVRVPAHPVALALLRASGVPIAAPSANRSLRLSPTRAEHVRRGLSGRIAMILDGGPTTGGLESTVLDLTATPPRLLRPGLVTPAEIEAIIGPIARPSAQPPTATALPSPGMMARHYAPRAPLELAEDDGEPRVAELLAQGVKVGWIALGATAGIRAPGLETIALPPEPAAYAAQLYAALHALDDAGVERIVVALPPDTEAWLAVRDRLRRAATPEETPDAG